MNGICNKLFSCQHQVRSGRTNRTSIPRLVLKKQEKEIRIRKLLLGTTRYVDRGIRDSDLDETRVHDISVVTFKIVFAFWRWFLILPISNEHQNFHNYSQCNQPTSFSLTFYGIYVCVLNPIWKCFVEEKNEFSRIENVDDRSNKFSPDRTRTSEQKNNLLTLSVRTSATSGFSNAEVLVI